MARFRYRAVDRAGKLVSGTVEGSDEAAAVARLRADGALPIKLSGEAGGGLMALLNAEITPREALSGSDRVALTRMLATLSGAGLPLDRTLSMAERLGANRAQRAVAGRLLGHIREGAKFADALDREGHAFPPAFRAAVRAGEAGAALEATLARLADALETEAKRRGEIRSALIYPAFLVVTAIGSVAVLLAYVVPTFEPLLAEAGVEPPLVTQIVIGTGRVVETWWPLMIGGLLTLVIGARLALLSPPMRLAWHRTLLRLPLIGRLTLGFETARLTRLLGSLLQNGVALPSALGHVERTAGNLAVAAEIRRVAPEVEAGRGIAGPLAEGRLLPSLALQLIQAGEESGSLTEMLLKTAEIYDTETRRGFDQALAVLTPAITLVMGVLIAVIISSILFALFSINELAV